MHLCAAISGSDADLAQDIANEFSRRTIGIDIE
jgi:hypothetical protein